VTEQELARAVSARYRAGWLRGYVRSKIASDPAYSLAARLVIDAGLPLIDVGCGAGVFAYYLHAMGFDRSIIGVDPDSRKIDAAERARRDGDEHIRFQSGGIEMVAGSRGGTSGTVVLLDVLHYMDEGAQTDLLDKAAARVAPQGLLLIRDTLADGSWRAGITKIQERMAMAVGWLRGGSLHFPTRSFLEATLSRQFELEIVPAFGRTPFNNYLVIARRLGAKRRGEDVKDGG